MAKIISAQEAARLIKDNDVVAFSADSLIGYPNEIVTATKERFLKEGHPANITSFRSSGMGDFSYDEFGEEEWCQDGMLGCSISSYVSVSPKLMDSITDNKVMGYMFPLGPLSQMTSDAARGLPGTLSKIGLGTFMDARYGGGKLNELTEEKGEDMVEYIPDILGEEYLFYKAPDFSVALLRGTSSDINGNVTCEKEAIRPGMLEVAQAVKTKGGIVIVQVERITAPNEMDPHLVEVPGIYVDYLVVEEKPKETPQTPVRRDRNTFNPSFTGGKVISMSGNNEVMPLSPAKVIARRAAMEVPLNGKCNFGLGMPQNIPSVLEECGVGDDIMMISETGVIGGVPAQGRDFGCHYNPEAICDRTLHFNFFDGGNLDMAVFGFSEIDQEGAMNTSHLNGKLTGIGGFTDIATSSKNIMIMGTYMAKAFKGEVKDGKLNIIHEGVYKKFIKKCEKVSFVASEFLKTHDSFLIITERCVVRVTKDGMILEEIAPGVDLQTQVLDLSEVDFIIPEGGPKLMDAGIFTEDDFHISK